MAINADNTPRETKNQIWAGFCSYLISQQVFSCIETQFLQVSHTHNELDQRFSSLASLIKKAECLETMEEMADFLKANMVPAQNRELMVEITAGTHDFKSWMAPCDFQVSGLTSTAKEPFTNHLWRFCRRADVGTMSEEIENSHPVWSSWQPSPDDVCLVLKQYMSSEEQSQRPQVILPVAACEKLTKQNLKPSMRNILSEETLNQFRKTAAVVSKAPWNLLKAQHFLEQLCAENEKQIVVPGFDLTFIFQGMDVEQADKSHVVDEALLPDEDKVPRKVQVAKSKTKKNSSIKRPAVACKPVARKPAAAAAAAVQDRVAVPGHPPEAAVVQEVAPAEPEALQAPGRVDRSEKAVDATDDAHVVAAALPPASSSAAAATQPRRRCKRKTPEQKVESAAADVVPGLDAHGEPIDQEGFTLIFGCSKCRNSKAGCKAQCQKWATTGHRGYKRSPAGKIYKHVREPQDVD